MSAPLPKPKLSSLFLAWIVGVWPALAEPSIQRIVPAAARPGATTKMVFRGEKLEGISQLWTSIPVQAEYLPEESGADRATFNVTVDGTVPLGVGAMRVYGTNGVSSLELFLIDDMNAVAAQEDKHSKAQAQSLTLPVAVDGQSKALALDFYRFQATAGQRVSVEILAQRIGSKMDPIVRILDEQGREVSYQDDDPGLGPDCRFEFVAVKAGDYWIEVRDVNYEGGSAYAYRLRVGNFSLATLPYPFAASPGESVSIRLLGPSTADSLTQQIVLSEGSPGASITVKPPGRSEASYAMVLTALRAGVLEKEPNDTREQAGEVKLPATIDGRFEQANDRDVFKFDGRKGERFHVLAHTRRAGSPCDVWMQLVKPDGSRVAESKVDAGEDQSLDHTLAEDGVYYLEVEEINRTGGPDLAYQLLAGEYHAGFDLTVPVDHVEADAAKTFSVKVSCVRRDYDGPIELSLAGFSGEANLENRTIEKKKEETTLKVTLADDVPPGTLKTFKIEGRAMIGDQAVSSVATILPALRKAFPNTRRFPPGIECSIVLTARPGGG